MIETVSRTKYPAKACLIFLILSAAGAFFIWQWKFRNSIPAVILITIDTLRADRLGCYGNAEVETPVLNRLSQDAIVFQNAFTPVPLTLPSHCSLFTGKYPAQHRVRDNDDSRLSDTETTLAELLRHSGYRCAAFVGSFVLDRRFGLSQGFDYYGDRMGRSSDHRPEVERTAQGVIRESLSWIAQQESRKPWFAWLHLFDPHDPYEPPEPFRSRYQGRLYDGEVAFSDDSLASLFDYLHRKDLYDHSLIVVTGDHGEALGEHGEPNHGLFLYDSTLRIPLLIKLPGNRFAGKRVAQPVSLVDLFPTILRALSIKAPDSVQGKEILSQIEKDLPPGDTAVYSESLYLRKHFGWSEQRSLRTLHHKYIDSSLPELYELIRDPMEIQNIVREQKERAAALHYDLQRHPGFDSGPAPTETLSTGASAAQKLASLGYLSVSQRPDAKSFRLPDPKQKKEVLQFVLRGMTLFKSGLYSKAAREFSLALRQSPELVIAQNFLGSCFFEMKNYPKAVSFFQRASVLEPASLVIQFNLARTYLQLGFLDQAADIFRRLTNSQPEDDAVWRELGKTYMAKEVFAEALPCFEAALRVAPDSAEDLYLIGMAKWRLNDLQAAQDFLKRAVALNSNLGEAYEVLGGIALQQSDLKLALRHYRKASEVNGQSMTAYYQLGVVLLQLDSPSEAVAALRRAVQLSPNSAEAHNVLGMALFRLKKNDLAIRAFEKAIRLQPGSSIFRDNRRLASRRP